MLRGFHRLITALAYFASGLFFFAGVITFYEIIVRYIFNAPTSWSMEIARLCLTWGIFLGGAYVFREGRLVDVDMIRRRLSGWLHKAVKVYIDLFVLAFAACTAYQGWLQFYQSFSMGSRTVTVLSLPVAVFDVALPVGMALLSLQAIVHLLAVVFGQRAQSEESSPLTAEVQHVD